MFNGRWIVSGSSMFATFILVASAGANDFAILFTGIAVFFIVQIIYEDFRYLFVHLKDHIQKDFQDHVKRKEREREKSEIYEKVGGSLSIPEDDVDEGALSHSRASSRAGTRTCTRSSSTIKTK